MPTTVVKTIGTAGGRDYSTIQAWEDACPANLVTDDKIWQGECYNDSEFLGTSGALLTVSGITTDSTRYLHLTAASGQSFADHANKATNPLRYDQSKGVGLRITGNYNLLVDAPSSTSRLLLSRLQLFYDSTYASGYYPAIVGPAIQDCIVQTRQNSSAGFCFGAHEDRYAANTAFISTGTGPSKLVLHRGTTAASFNIRNCTIVKASDASSGGSAIGTSFGGTFVVKNTAVFGPFSTTIDSGTLSSSSDRIYTDASSVPAGTNHSTSLTYSAQIEDTTIAAFDGRAKSTGALKGAATRDQTYTNDLDIVGRARSTTTPSIGAWEVPSGPVLSFPTVTDITSTSVRPRVTITY